jgi:hypothetical protein
MLFMVVSNDEQELMEGPGIGECTHVCTRLADKVVPNSERSPDSGHHQSRFLPSLSPLMPVPSGLRGLAPRTQSCGCVEYNKLEFVVKQ